MNEQIKEIAQRLIGLRDVLELSQEEVAECCNVTIEEYKRIESGEVDIPVGLLYDISKKYNIGMSILMFGEEARMESYFLTRKDKGATVERTKAYKYQSLAAGFAKKKASPFLVKIEPHEGNSITLNNHEGQEFNMVMEGRMLISIDGKELVLESGDSIYFDSTKPHGIRALDGETVKLLAVII